MGGWVAAFVQRLRELGWIEGRNIAIEYRWAEGSYERAAEFATELVLPCSPAGDIGYPNCVCTISRPSSRWLRRELGTTRRERNRAFDALPRYCWQAT